MTFSSTDKLYEDFISPDVTVFDENAVKNAVRNILLTKLGELPGIPQFGSRMYEIPFNMNDSSTQLLIKRLVTECLSQWENRIHVDSVEIINNYNSVIVKIEYLFKDSSLRSSVSVKIIG